MAAKDDKNALVHPADGLYATSVDRLDALYACDAGRFAFRSAAEAVGDGAVVGDDTDVDVTWALLVEVMERYKAALGWLLDELHERGRVTYEEIKEASTAHYRPAWDTKGGREEAAKAVMDLLLVRAKREGLVAA